MVLFHKSFLADEELGKKDDDHRPPPGKWRAAQMAHWRKPRLWRLLIALAACYLLYIFFKNMPTDLTPAEERYNPLLAQLRQQQRLAQSALPSTSPSTSADAPYPSLTEELQDRFVQKDALDYEGPISFEFLAQTLRLARVPLNRFGSSSPVVFAAANLKSVSELIPLACEMARRRQNDVHLVLMGRDDISFAELQEVNGISDAVCPITWHDARPNNAQSSTDARMERAVIAGLAYVRAYLRPQAVITLSESHEDTFFSNGVSRKARESGFSHISLPGTVRDLMWIAHLDSNALRVWNEVEIEILIHAPPDSSGSVVRLLKSLMEADFLGSIPSVTLELPLHADPQLLDYLHRFKWPSPSSGKLTIRRRVEPDGLTQRGSSIRTVEAFYPRDPGTSHVLVLSPQTQLAPSFYHYLKYIILGYRQSPENPLSKSSKLLGISLELPSSRPTDGEPFSPPTLPAKDSDEPLPHFLWQSPNSNAALYFGDKWAEFHTFLSRRLAAQAALPPAQPQQKLISKKFPAFMEYLFEFVRVKGYYMLYPSFPNEGTFSLATVHNDLYQLPEESLPEDLPSTAQPDIQALDDTSEPLVATSVEQLGSVERPLNRASTIMGFLDRFALGLPALERLDLLSYDGRKLSSGAYSEEAAEYSRGFRSMYGGCRDSEESAGREAELFCVGQL